MASPIRTPFGLLTFDNSTVGYVTSGILGVIAIDPSLIAQDGASTGDVLTWDGSAWGPAAPTGGSVLDLEGGSQATTLYGSDVEGGDEATLYNPLFDLDDGGP